MRVMPALLLLLAGCAAPTGVAGVRDHFATRPADRKADPAALEADGRWLDAGELRFEAGAYEQAAHDAWRWLAAHADVAASERERARRLYNHAVAAHVIAVGAEARPRTTLRSAYNIRSRLPDEYGAPGGFGAPFVIVPDGWPRRELEDLTPGLVTGAHGFVAPTTAVLTFAGGRSSLAFHDPMRASHVMLGGRPHPLESNVMAALELRLEAAEASEWEREAVRRPALKHAGFTLMELPKSDKIPVILLHGLKQGPTDYAKMVAGLAQDPTVRTRYQFIAYRWATGLPLPLSVALFKRQLAEFWSWFDARAPRARRQGYWMVGHSMGGLLAKTMAVASGDRILDALFRVPRAELDLQSEMGRSLERALVYRPDPQLAGVIFLAVPHRGSGFAFGPIGGIGRSLIQPADDVRALKESFAEAYGDQLEPAILKRLESKSTSVRNLRPDDEYLRALAACPFGPGIEIHSVIGGLYGSESHPIGDGVVSYKSAHLAGATSETVVRAGHNLHKSRAGIDAVKRILLANVSE